MYGANDDGDLVELKETPFLDEPELQSFLTKHPELLAGDQMNPTDPRRFMLITAEAGIAITEAGGDHFSLDHLFVDQDGIPTLIEVKRSSDTRIRREVIGQMLEYAANACAYWNVNTLRSMFARRCQKSELSPEQELAKITLGPETDLESIWERVAQNLKQKRLRLVFLADKFPLETQRIIEFLNEQMQASEVYAVEVRQYAGGGMKTLVPRVLNPSVLEADRRAAAAGRGEPWTAERFYSALSGRWGEDAVKVMRTIHGWSERQPHIATYFGRGKSDGSIIITFKRGDDPSIYQTGDSVLMTLWSYGRVEIDFQYLMSNKVFASEGSRENLRQRITSESHLTVPPDKIDKRPSIPWKELTDPTNMQALLTAMEWAIGEFTKPEATPS
jgi:hypothetical protein